MLTCLKTSRGILIPLSELKKLLGATHKIKVTSEKVRIREKNYKEAFEEALQKARKAKKSDFVNL
ncbi:hypothetical protein KAI54_02100 [Candidatus Gracilibacteria bacterium]|nr:hypothetical protein [Candidatus Gracilibacteria bacterium]